MANSRIDPNDSGILFVDLQTGIVELSRTITVDRLRQGVLGLSKLAAIFGIPAIVSGVPGQDGSASTMISQIAEGMGEYSGAYMVAESRLSGEQISIEIRLGIEKLQE